MRIRVILAIPFLLLPLSSCSGGEEGCTTREIDAMRICLSNQWRELSEGERKNMQLTEETIAAFSKGSVNLTVTREPLLEAMDQLTYGEQNMKSVTTLPEYVELSKEKLKTAAGKAWLHIFQTGNQKFLQLSLVSDSIGYTVTAAMPTNTTEESEEEIAELLKDVKLNV